jgi:hypothetical protein
MGEVLAGWQNNMTFHKVTDTIVDGDVVKSVVSTPFQGMFQPMRPRELTFKPEGERNWKWWTLLVRTGLEIENGDIIVDDKGVEYKVMKSQDWSQAGYLQLDLVLKYQERV